MRSTLRQYLVALVVAVAVMVGVVMHAPAAKAGNPAAGQKIASGQTSIASGTPAVIVTGTSGQKIVVTAMKLATVSTGGVVTFYDGAATTTALFTAYVPASTSVNNNVDITSDFLGNAWPTLAGGAGTAGTSYGTAGNSLCAQLNGCTLVYSVTYYVQ